MFKSTSRRFFLLTPLLGTQGALYARFVEPEWLEFSERSCRLPGVTREFSLVHLSDLHASKDVPQPLIERAIQMAVDAKPDVICLTGDFVTSARDFDPRWYMRVLAKLASTAPTFAVLGNHDGGLWAANSGGFATTRHVARMIEGSGVQLLGNRSVRLSCKGGIVQLVGVGDMWARELNGAAAFREAQPGLPTVLLSHNPDSKDLLGSFDWHLMLSGHTHGGQVVLPVLGLNPAPVKDRRYTEGLKPWRNRWIHVSRGVGSIKGIRFNCRPELTRLKIGTEVIS